ncbi:uncharacterized protein BXZ73DRAFT_59274 [Epithele typhae]|uniref:uncharacterized protein n=1 Tax=Epithele typhae TaxID=378194 RepID=UPI00200748A2|nr:uncharacterized protein BXZ73DRAFT_59274 [Epithele typhae]KAH9910127.1 hypothetical protein BXZ73DRAFT_59274 [Epithele typhae]
MAGKVDLLILGAGWTSTFLAPLCASRGVSHAATTRTGRDGTLPFDFDPASDAPAPFRALPAARAVLVAFPLRAPGAAARLVRLYRATHGDAGPETLFVALGSTGIWDGSPTMQPDTFAWTDRHSPVDPTNARAAAEEELLALSPGTARTTVLDLSGLWGGARQPRNWVARVAASKDALRAKGSIHMVHGLDVARAVLAVAAHPERAAGQRWLLTDTHVYDWWDWAAGWGSEEQQRWVQELMDEAGVRALPRPPEMLGRAMDSVEFWRTFGLAPLKGRLGED